MEVVVTSENFENEVIKSDIPVLCDFWATWCGPCMMLSPVIEEFAKKYEGKIKVAKINVDEQLNLAKDYGIMSIPTLILFKNGEIISKTLGYMQLSEVETFAQAVL